MFGTAKRISHGLLGGLFDGQPGAFSQHQGGLRGLLGGGAPSGIGVSQLPPAQPRGLDEALSGLGIGAGAGVGVQAGTVQRPKRDGVSFGRTLEDFLFTDKTWSQSKEAQRAAQAGAEQREALMGLAGQVIKDPREWMVFMSDPEAWSKANATRLEAATVAEGSARLFGDPSMGGSVFTAPKYGVSGDQFYTQGSDGVEITGQRAPTFAEQSSANKALADIDAQLEELRIKRQQLALEGEKHKARVAGGGYGTPGVGMAATGGGIPDGWVVE